MARIFKVLRFAILAAAFSYAAHADQPVQLTVQGGAGQRALCLHGYGVAGSNPDDICVPIGTFDPVAHTASITGGLTLPSLGLLAPYTGAVATRGYVPDLTNGGSQQSMMRSIHVARDTITSLQVVYGNWYAIPGGAETGLASSMSVTASIEYPVGTFTQVTFNNSATGSIASGATIVSDPVSVSIPRGAQFFVRSWKNSASGIIYTNTPANVSAGEAFLFGATTPDLTMGGTVTDGDGGSNMSGPLAIIGTTTRPSVFISGDSRAMGLKDTPDIPADDLGDIARSVGPSFSYINAGISGDTVNAASTNYTKRLALSQYCSHIVVNYGVNDLFAGRTAAQVQSSLTTLYGLFGGKPIIQATIEPETTSTDSWATTVNQTKVGWDSVRITVNNWIRSVPPLTIGYLEVADVYETARNSGLFKVNGTANYFTSDGVHGVLASYQQVQVAIQPQLNALISKPVGR
jgi:hypothetical protein